MRKYVILPQKIIEACILSKKNRQFICQIIWEHLHEPMIDLEVENWMELM